MAAAKMSTAMNKRQFCSYILQSERSIKKKTKKLDSTVNSVI